MNKLRVGLVAVIATASSSFVLAQTSQPPSSDPSAASSPSQRQVTGNGSAEASTGATGSNPSDASSPHQRNTVQGASSAGSASPATFVKMAAQDGMTEVALGKLAQQKSNDPQVKQFAQEMVQDHGKADEELAQLAKSKNLTVPTQLDAAHQKMVDSLSAKSGAAFDSAYASHMAKDHTKAIHLFQAAQNSADPDIAGFARQTLPTLQEHKRLADHLASATQAGHPTAE